MEGLDYYLTLAERYRDMLETATAPTELRGVEPNDLFMLEERDKDGKGKGIKKITGKKANLASAPTRKVLPTGGTRKPATPVPMRWNGDWPLLAKIDAGQDLTYLRAKLGFVPKILEAFEWAVIDIMTLAEIGRMLGAGSKGGKARRERGFSTGSISSIDTGRAVVGRSAPRPFVGRQENAGARSLWPASTLSCATEFAKSVRWRQVLQL